MVRWPGAIVSVWFIIPTLFHRFFYYCVFYYIPNHKIASGNSIFSGHEKTAVFLRRKEIEGESERSVENVEIDIDNSLRSSFWSFSSEYNISNENQQFRVNYGMEFSL